MPENEELHYDENTLRKVYEGLLAAGVYGQQAVDAVNQMQNQGILFRENKPKKRGRPAAKPAVEAPKHDPLDDLPQNPEPVVQTNSGKIDVPKPPIPLAG